MLVSMLAVEARSSYFIRFPVLCGIFDFFHKFLHFFWQKNGFFESKNSDFYLFFQKCRFSDIVKLSSNIL